MSIEAGVYGVICFGVGVTLREGNREYFYAQLDKLFPGMKERYIKNYGNSYLLESPDNQELMRYFHQKCEKHNIGHNNEKIFQYLQTFEEKERQLSIWDWMS